MAGAIGATPAGLTVNAGDSLGGSIAAQDLQPPPDPARRVSSHLRGSLAKVALARFRDGEVSTMASVHDVAAAVLRRTGPISTMKLQKLVYYCQAWHLVWEEEPLFSDRIEAWAGGPVTRSLYAEHKGRYTVDSWPGDAKGLAPCEMATVEAVVEAYDHLSGQQLSALTHRERPWREARTGLGPGERGNREITVEALQCYYSDVASDPEAQDIVSIPADTPPV